MNLAQASVIPVSCPALLQSGTPLGLEEGFGSSLIGYRPRFSFVLVPPVTKPPIADICLTLKHSRLFVPDPAKF